VRGIETETWFQIHQSAALGTGTKVQVRSSDSQPETRLPGNVQVICFWSYVKWELA
jgi:hypothetical protein